MSRTKNLYVGRAGQMAVMAELLWRGWNVALPEVDVGDDVLVVKDDSGDLWRIQVKTEHVVLRLVSSGTSLWCSRRDFRPYRSDWSRWPVIPH